MLPGTVTQARTVQELAGALAEWACGWAGAHGAAVWVDSGGGAGLTRQGECGFGLALARGEWVGPDLQAPREDGLLCTLPFGTPPHAAGALELVAAAPGWQERWAEVAPLLGLALEAVQAREQRQRGQGRTALAVEALTRRIDGSLEHGRVLGATAEVAAQALGFRRAFAGLLGPRQESEQGPHCRIPEVWSVGFGDHDLADIGVGPVTYAALMKRGEAVSFHAERDEGTPLARGLSELRPQPHAALLVPLRVRGQPLGLLYADTDQPSPPPSPGDRALLLELAGQAGLALANAHRFAQAVQGQRTESALREVGQALAGSLNLTDTLQVLLEHGRRLLGADAAAIYTPHEHGRTLRIHSALDLPSDYLLGAQSRPGSGVTGRAFSEGQRQQVTDFPASGLGGDCRYVRQLLAQGRYPYRGLLALPLQTRAGPFGVLTLHYTGPLDLSDSDLALADALAVQANLALENARLYREEREREREAAALLDITRLLDRADSGRLTLPGLLQVLLDAAGAARGLLLIAGWGLVTDGVQASDDDLGRLTGELGRGPRPLGHTQALDGAGSALVAPVRQGDTLLGLFYADDPDRAPPPAATLRLTRRLCTHLAEHLTRRELAAALVRQEAQYRQLAEAAHDLILTTDADAAVTYANPAALAVAPGALGQSLAALCGQDAEGWQSLWAQLQRLRPGERPLRADVTLSGRPLEIQLSPLPGSGGVLVVGRDLSHVQRLADEIRERGRALDAAATRQSELRTFLALFTQAQEEERRRIARELHDETAQLLVASRRRLLRLAREAGSGGSGGPLPPTHAQALSGVADELSDIAAGVRRFARNLRPSVLDDLGLHPALEWLCAEARTPARLEVSGEEVRLDPWTEVTLFRLIGEALTNVDKHAGASSAAVRLSYRPGELVAAVTDDGAGFDPAQAQALAAQGHLGLLGLRERARLSGGDLTLDSAPGAGTTVTIRLPLPAGGG